MQCDDVKIETAIHNVRSLSMLLGAYGVAMGAILIPIGLFAGLSVLFGSLLHFIAGLLYVWIGFDIEEHPQRSARFAFWQSSLLSTVLAIGIVGCMIVERNVAAAIWFAIVFCFTVVIVQYSRIVMRHTAPKRASP